MILLLQHRNTTLHIRIAVHHEMAKTLKNIKKKKKEKKERKQSSQPIR